MFQLDLLKGKRILVTGGGTQKLATIVTQDSMIGVARLEQVKG